MYFKHLVVLSFVFAAYQIVQITSRVELTNLKCIPLDKSFADFEYCRIKAVNRSYKYLALKVNLFKVPVTNVSINVSVLKRLNGYKPFLYNITFDACKFMSSKNTNPLIKYFYSFISEHSNMNHSCPYSHDLIVDKVSIEFLNHQLTEVLPVPEGDYAFYTSWYAYGKNRADVRIYATIT
ncbi:uncharacterized protein Dwil_GK27959 [Drosophila willistoni]|uniref:MD-2-related lipid-recognition domain-containing protein n=1 Tax=Drosophila willistoni TaxID=7260 RepID=A0A0Q9WQX3_DROWI|nr:uncharacterized protein LOC26529961 [Drosophila willistoni]KRF98628.1 uncharacterized protein Dwil_GK27959 [Drosophila willistoni]